MEVEVLLLCSQGLMTAPSPQPNKCRVTVWLVSYISRRRRKQTKLHRFENLQTLKWIQSKSPPPPWLTPILVLFSHICFRVPSRILSGFSTRISYNSFTSTMPFAYTRHVVFPSIFFLWRLQPNRGLWPPHSWGFFEIAHNDTPQSVGLLCTSDQPVAETSTWQHTTLTTDKLPCPRRDSNPQSQQASGRRPTP